MTLFIPYYRVSTAKQGRSGLGLEAQQAIVKAYVDRVGGTILQEFTEVESGKSRTRPELMKAVGLSKSKQAVIIVAKLDRLARDAEFSFMIANRSHDIVCCDFPEGNKLLFGIMAVLAEYERTLISGRTKGAWKALKERGYVHDTCKTRTEADRDASLALAREKSAQVRKEQIAERDAQVRAMAQMMKGSTLQQIADRLNELNYRAPKGGLYNKEAVRRVLA